MDNRQFSFFGIVSVLSLLLVAGIVPTVAYGAVQPVSRAIQITTDPHYDRNPSIFQAKDGTYWLFFTRGTDPRGLRGFNGYDPDSDLYDIYYKTAKSLLGLQKAVENKVPGSTPANGQRDVAALQASDGKIWVFSSTGFGPGVNHIYYYTYDGAWSGPTPMSFVEPLWIGHIDAVEDDGRILIVYDAEYNLKALYYNGAWNGPYDIRSTSTLGKAIAQDGTFYVVWSHLDVINQVWGGYIGLSTSQDGAIWTDHGQIAACPEATNWDPVLVKDGDMFRLFWAPDAGSEGQFIATSMSSNPTDQSSWSAPVRVTTASYGTESWWDFWPEAYKKGRGAGGSPCLLYTSERNRAGTGRIDANIWMYVSVPLED